MHHRGSFILAGAVAAMVVAGACGGGNGTNASSFPGGDGGGGDGAMSSGSSGSSSTSGSGSFGDSGSGKDGSNSSSGAGGMDASYTGDADFPCDGCAPFPAQDAGACSPSTLGPPTLVYPPDGVLLPPNMNVLEVQWVPPSTGTAALYEVDFTNGVTDVRVETPCNEITTVRQVANVGCGLTLAQQEWNDIADTNRDGDPVKITVRAEPAGGACVSGSQQSVSIAFAKDNLAGGIYYWQSAPSTGSVPAGHAGGIYYHDFGTFDPTPTPFWTASSSGKCIGCHTLSKDGVRMSLMNDDEDADDEYGDVQTLTMDVGSRTVLGGKNLSPGFQTYTHDHALMVATVFKNANPPDTSFAVWNGDGTTMMKSNALPSGMQGSQPNLSWDDKTLVFVAPTYGTVATNANDIPGGLGGAGGDDHFFGGSLYQATFDAASYAIGTPSAFLTATASQSFYYPDQSVDGNWVVLNENDDNSTGNNQGDCFYNRQSTVEIMHFPPQSGDMPLALPKLNMGPGLSNSWPRWSPAVTSYHGKAVLWVTFSSNRDYGLHLKNTVNGYPQGSPLPDGSTASYDNYYPPEGPSYDQPQPLSKMGITFGDYAAPQIWMAAIIVDPDRALDAQDRSYPAFWLPFQDVTAHNHSAQWVSQVQTGSSGGDGGASSGSSGSSSGTGSSSGSGTDAAPSCNESGGACGPNGGTCCADVVCCPAATYSCQYSCSQ